MNISYFNAVADPSLDRSLQVAQFLSTQAVALSLKGVPGIYVHSILGSENWKEGLGETGVKRSINRERLVSEEVERELKDPASLRKQVFDRYSHLLKIRTGESAFSPLASQTVRDYGPDIFAVERVSQDGRERILALQNIANKDVSLSFDNDLHDLISDQDYQQAITLKPYQTAWLKG
jgi:sucrose phosphorylase